MFLVKVSISLVEYETCGVVEYRFHTQQRELNIILVDYDSQYQSGLLYVMDTAQSEPHCDLTTGDVKWRGYEQSVWLIRQKSHEGMELPKTAGVYLGKFPDPRVGRWLVFSRVLDKLPSLRPVPRQPRLDNRETSAPPVQAAGRSEASSPAHTGSVWPADEQ